MENKSKPYPNSLRAAKARQRRKRARIIKTTVTLVLVAAVVAGAALVGWNIFEKEVLLNPERQIIGLWKTENEALSFEFREDGTMSGNVDIIGVVTVDGTYKINRESGVITLTYSIGKISYDSEKLLTIVDDTLTLKDSKTNIETVYYKVETD